MRFFAHTRQGLKRPVNQDRYLVKELPGGGVMAAVADGMGGAAGGEVAAQTAVDLLAGARNPLPRDHRALGELFSDICHGVFLKAQDEPELEDMGTTLTAVLVGPGRVDWAHVGDSRLYRWHGGRLAQVTRDHTAVAFMVEEGMLAKEEAAGHPARHLLFDCVGCGDCTPDTGSFTPERGELLLLSSDGLHDKVADQQIEEVLNSEQDLSALAHGLVKTALDAGGHDDITVVLVRV